MAEGIQLSLSQIKSNFQNYIANGPWGHWPSAKKEIAHVDTPVVLITFENFSSILIPLIEKNGRVCVILTTRSLTISSHKGQVCFPGGRREHSDSSAIHTALREAEEEIGLPPSSVQVIGSIGNMPATPHYVTVIIGVVTDKNFKPKISVTEVANYFYCPLEFFLSTDYVETHYLDIESDKSVDKFLVFTYHYFCPETKITHKIWGLTGSLALFISCIGHNTISPIENFTWKPCSETDNRKAYIPYLISFDITNNRIVFHLLSHYEIVTYKITSRL